MSFAKLQNEQTFAYSFGKGFVYSFAECTKSLSLILLRTQRVCGFFVQIFSLALPSLSLTSSKNYICVTNK